MANVESGAVRQGNGLQTRCDSRSGQDLRECLSKAVKLCHCSRGCVLSITTR